MVIRIIRTIGFVIAGVLAIGILLVAVDANEGNGLVNAVLEAGRFFAQPFRQIIELDDNTLQIAINWGIAALVYIAIAALIAAAVRAVVTRREGNSPVGTSS